MQAATAQQELTMDLIKELYIFSPLSKQKSEILFEITRACVWLKLYICSTDMFEICKRPRQSGWRFATFLN